MSKPNADLRNGLILLTLVSVVADSMLLPFYPQFFSQEFNQHSPQHTGYYIAACCFTVMVAFPVWARIAKKVNELHLWVYTQIISGILGVSCFYVESLLWFWVLSQAMLIFKASYLLIYPFVMRLEEHERHLGVASLFSVLMHFGAIGGAILGGFFLEYNNPRSVYILMAATDVLQVVICLLLIYIRKVPLFQCVDMPTAEESSCINEAPQQVPETLENGRRFLLSLGIISALFYFSTFLIRPFFSTYWQSVSESNNAVNAAFIYSLPAWVALLGLWFNHRRQGEVNHYRIILTSLCFAVIGVGLQSIEQVTSIIVGRCLFGWALFQITVRLEVVMFEFAHKDNYAVDFSKIYIFQNIGVLAASFGVGSLISWGALQMPFWVSLAGFLMTIVIFYILFFSKITSFVSVNKEVEST